jgi:hypothetical protein
MSMRMIRFLLIFLIAAPFWAVPKAFSEINTNDLLVRSDKILRGESHHMTVDFKVKTARWERQYKIEVWMKGVDFSFARVLEPAKSEGQGFLRIKARLWNYLPSAERTILIPPSMMLDQFMGSDFSNDDFVKLSYLPRDYTSELASQEEIEGIPVYHLILTPKPDAPVTYGKLETWVRTSDAAPVRTDFYDEDLELIRTLEYSEFKSFGGHEIPSIWRMQNHKEPDRTTTITVLNAVYNLDIPDSRFTREQLERYP